MKFAIILIMFVLLLIIIDQFAVEQAEIIEDPFTVYFCPREDCLTALINSLNQATSSIHCAFYDLTQPEIISLLQEKPMTIDMKMVVEGHNNGTLGKTVPNGKTMHNKFCIIDNHTTVTGSLNPTIGGLPANNNNLLIINSQKVAQTYEEEFQELFSGVFGGGDETIHSLMPINNQTVEVYFCPEDNCEREVIKEIISAKESIEFMTYSFTSDEISNAILISGLPYRGIFDESQISEYSEFSVFKNVRIDGNPSLMHHKVFIIDNSTVITGSYNPTQNGNSHNDENMVIIHDSELVHKYHEEFEILWNEASER